MNDEVKQAIEKSHAIMQEAHPRERATFKALLLTNPNYFGNLAESPFTPVIPISINTHYEELVCVGYHPQQERHCTTRSGSNCPAATLFLPRSPRDGLPRECGRSQRT